MALAFDTIQRDGVTLETVHIETAEDMYDLRDNHANWTENALSILTYPTAPPTGFLSHDIPRGYGSISFIPGATITKDSAGNFGYIQPEEATA